MFDPIPQGDGSPSPSARSGTAWLGWALGCAALALLLFVATPAEATHYRGGHLEWRGQCPPPPVPYLRACFETANATVIFDGHIAVRADWFGTPIPSLGAGVNPSLSLDFGDGSPPAPICLQVQEANASQNYIVGWIRSAGCAGDIVHTYSPLGGPTTQWTASVASCCRISATNAPNGGDYEHINNPNLGHRLESRVALGASLAAGYSPALIQYRNVVPCPAAPVACRFLLGGFEAQGDAVTYRVSTAAEAGDAAFVQPTSTGGTAGFVAAESDEVAWDTTGATTATAPTWTLYSMQAMLEDSRSSSPVDFFIRLDACGDAEAPMAPRELQARVSSGDSIQLAWKAPTMHGCISGYRVYRSVNGGSFGLLATSGGTSYDDVPVQACAEYAYRVTAVAASGAESPPSGTVRAKIWGVDSLSPLPSNTIELQQDVCPPCVGPSSDELIEKDLDPRKPDATNWALRKVACVYELTVCQVHVGNVDCCPDTLTNRSTLLPDALAFLGCWFHEACGLVPPPVACPASAMPPPGFPAGPGLAATPPAVVGKLIQPRVRGSGEIRPRRRRAPRPAASRGVFPATGRAGSVPAFGMPPNKPE